MVCILLMGFLSLSISCYSQMMERVSFTYLQKRIQHGVEYTQQMAWLRQVNYTIEYTDREIYSRDASNIYYKIRIPSSNKIIFPEKGICFPGTLAPSSCGTIILTNTKLKQSIHITVRPVTGKVAIYEDKTLK